MFQGSRTQTTEVKPDVGANTNDINVKVISAAGEEIHFKTKRTTKISKLQDAFANKVGRKVGGIRFSYDGAPINNDDTPASLDMKDNGTIDAMVMQTSG